MRENLIEFVIIFLSIFCSYFWLRLLYFKISFDKYIAKSYTYHIDQVGLTVIDYIEKRITLEEAQLKLKEISEQFHLSYHIWPLYYIIVYFWRFNLRNFMIYRELYDLVTKK